MISQCRWMATGSICQPILDCLIAPLLADKADFVVGSRYLEHEGFQSSRLRRAGGSFLSRWLHLLTGITVRDVTSGFRAVNRKGIALFAAEYAQDYPEPEALTLAALRKLRILEVPVRMRERSGRALFDLGRSLGVLYDQGDIGPACDQNGE